MSGDEIMGDAEMIEILQEIARSGKSHGARIDAIKELKKIRDAAAEREAAVPAAKADGDDFGGLYEVENPGRVRRAS